MDSTKRRTRLGMTLIEIMIVVVIMALVATGVGMAVMPAFGRAKIKATETSVQAVRAAVIAYRVAGYEDCPSIERLLEQRMLDRQTASTDAWNRAFAIECADGDVVVRSAGPDGELGTADDIPERL